jgi:hypothetical protein
MAYLIGTDEAGYGPKLGPLVVSATIWQVPDGDFPPDLYRVLGDFVTDTPTKDQGRVAIADSKALFSSRGSLAALERGVLPVLAMIGKPVATWRELLATLDSSAAEVVKQLPWQTNFNALLPIDLDAEVVDRLAAKWSGAGEKTGCGPVRVASRIVFPHQFNDLIDRLGGKGAALTELTLALVADNVDESEAAKTLVICDRHGGRKKYAAAIQHAFPDWMVRVDREQARESAYRTGWDGQLDFRFQVGGEAFLPTALASMASKYVREVAMRAFNEFWCGQAPGVKPTAGYPVDAARFFEEIAPARKKLGIEDRLLWRSR